MSKCIVRYCAYGSKADCFYTEDGGKSAKVFDSVKDAKYVMWQLKCCKHTNVQYLIVK